MSCGRYRERRFRLTDGERVAASIVVWKSLQSRDLLPRERRRGSRGHLAARSISTGLETRVSSELPAQDAREQSRLDFEHATIAYPIAEERVGD